MLWGVGRILENMEQHALQRDKNAKILALKSFFSPFELSSSRSLNVMIYVDKLEYYEYFRVFLR